MILISLYMLRASSACMDAQRMSELAKSRLRGALSIRGASSNS